RWSAADPPHTFSFGRTRIYFKDRTFKQDASGDAPTAAEEDGSSGDPPPPEAEGASGARLLPAAQGRGGGGGAGQSAVERLEADKAKYVKSQGALSKRQPLEERKGPLEVLELRNGPLEMKKGPLEVRKGPLEVRKGPLEVLEEGPLELKKVPLEVLEVRKGPLEVRKGPLEVLEGPLELKKVPLELKKVPLEVLEVRKGPLEVKKGPLEVRKGPLEVRKGPLMSSAAMRPTRKTNTKPGGAQLDLQHLSNLISVSEGGAHCEEREPAETADSTQQGPQQQKERPCPPPRPDWSSPAKIRLKTSVSTLMEDPGSPGSPPAAGTVRRVDVLPPACRPPHYMLQPLQPLPLHPQSPLHPGPSHLRLFHTRTTPRASPLKLVVAAYKPECPAGKTPSSSSSPSPFPTSLPASPPPPSPPPSPSSPPPAPGSAAPSPAPNRT
ncbi:hypothetical protein F7725_001250, partial [Dissostichus mawsoni]